MIGMKSSKDSDFFFSQEKEKKVKKSMQIKFIVLIILSNIFTAVLVSPNKRKIESKKVSAFKLTKKHSKLLLELSVSIPLLSNEKTPVELYNKKGVHISSNAFIHKKIETDNSIHGRHKYEVEVSNQDIHKFIGLSQEKIIAMAPHQRKIVSKTIKEKLKRKEENHEINF